MPEKGETITFTPPHRDKDGDTKDTRVRSDKLHTSDTKEEEHAVSTLKQGPCRPYVYERRPEPTLEEKPVTINKSEDEDLDPTEREKDGLEIPTYTPMRASTTDEPTWTETNTNKQREDTNKLRCCGSIINASAWLRRNAKASNENGLSIDRLKRVEVAPSPERKAKSTSQSANGITETESQRSWSTSKRDEVNNMSEEVDPSTLYATDVIGIEFSTRRDDFK